MMIYKPKKTKKNMKKSISIVIPAYNEEKNLKDAVESALKALSGLFNDYEILIFDDCSKDRTGEIADSLRKKNKKIRVIHNNPNKGFGYNYIKGIELAKKEYYTLFPGDNENDWHSFRETLKQIGKADIIETYTINKEVRQWHRKLISWLFTGFMNTLFGLKLKYFNGNNIYRTELLKKVKVENFGFAYSAEILIKLIKQGYSYTEFPVKIKPTGKTTLFKLKNVYRVIKTIFSLIYEVKIRDSGKYNKKPILVK